MTSSACAETSRFKGVSWSKGRWKAGIQKDEQPYKIGYVDDENAAAEAYDEMAIELYGEVARINFPDGIDAWLARESQVAEERETAGAEEVIDGKTTRIAA